MVTSKRLKEVLHYDPVMGLFTWLKHRGRVTSGTIAGNLSHPRGYVTIQVDGQRYLAHRLAWLYVYGKWPKEELDHIDGNTEFNAIKNLREATRSENCQNNKKAVGVRFTKGKWQAEIMINYEYKYLGRYMTYEEARAAYLAAKKEFHPFS